MFSKAKKSDPARDHNANQTPAMLDDDNGSGKSGSRTSAKSQVQSTTSKASSKRNSSMKSPGVPSLISSDVTLEGNLVSSGEVQFDGAITGNIRAASLIIGEKASVKGEVACEAVTVRGRVEGMVRARNVALASTAYIEGDIMHSSLSVEPGAHFDGNCRHSDDPLADDASKAFDRPVSGGPSKSTPRPVPSSNLDQAGSNLMGSNGYDRGSAAPLRPDFSSEQQRFSKEPAQNGQGGGASSFLAKNRSPLR